MVPARSLFAVLAAGALALLPACSAGAGNGDGEDRDAAGPVVLAAASLHEALSEAAGAWAAKGHPAPRLSFAASSALARQIEGGAPADLFVSADAEWMDRLDRAGLLRPGSRADLLANELVLIAPAATPAAATAAPPPAGLSALGAGRVAMADPQAVPAGRYARAALDHLGLWTAVAPRVVPAENVRAALALVERGEVPLGIVYATDAQASPRVAVIHRFAPASHPPIRYPVAILAAALHRDAPGLRAFLASPQAARIFARHGFAPLSAPAGPDAAAPAGR